MIIAIDGPSGTGKSTVAKGVAKRLGFTFFDTGAMYRSATWWVLKNEIDPSDEAKVASLVCGFRYEIKTESSGERRYFVDGSDVTTAIRSPEITALSSKIAAYGQVRAELVKIQRAFGEKQDAVFEGRDMGTVVFPNAEVKVFLTARPEVRAKRRYRELLMKFPDASLSEEQILQDIEKRDHTDSTRAVSPLRKGEDATLIDTSDLTVTEVIEQIIKLAAAKQPAYRKMRMSYSLICWLARTLAKLFYSLEVYGLSHFRPGSAIIAANHSSNLDPPIVSASCPEEVHFLAKESLFRVPILGTLIRHLNSHPVSRDAADAATFRLIISLLQSGQKVILFPEGKRSKTGELQPIERGLPFLMMKAKCPIQPVYIDGAFAIWKRGQTFPRLRGKIRCVFGSPIEWSQFEGLEKREAESRIAEQMALSLRSLKEWVEFGAVGTPP